MAAVDKIYGSNKEYDQFYKWAEDNNPELLNHFYPKADYIPTYSRPITNFPEKHDKWLLKNCPIKWVTDRIKEQYDI